MHDHDSPQRHPLVFQRRQLLKGSAALAAGATTMSVRLHGVAAQVNQGTTSTAATPVPAASPVAVADYVPVALRLDEYMTLTAAVERLIPADDLGPGASEIGAQVYIDRALLDRKAASLPAYRLGLAALNVEAGAAGFASLSPDKQDDLLKMTEAGKLSGGPAGFFAMLLQDTREGMFSDPIHGGNANFAGWDLIRYPGIRLVWTEQDQKINAPFTPEHVSVAKFQEKSS